MKHHYKTTDVGPQTVTAQTGRMVASASKEALIRLNGGLPPNLHMANRSMLIRLIKELHDENKRLRAVSPS